MLTDAFSHVARHGKGGSSGSGDDSCGVFWVGSSVGLGEFEGSEVGTCLVAIDQLLKGCVCLYVRGEGAGIGFEETSVGIHGHGDDQCAKEIDRILSSVTFQLTSGKHV